MAEHDEESEEQYVDHVLILKSHGGEGDEDDYLIIDRSPFSVGRRPENSAQVLQPDVSGTHAIFRYALDHSEWWVADNQSTNGTYINGRRLTGSAAIRLGDVLYFASKGYQVVPRIEKKQPTSFATTVLADSSTKIKGMMELLSIVKEQRTYPVFQSIVDLKNGNKVVGWEALGRAMAAEGPVGPAGLFPLASENRVEGKLSVRFRESALACVECQHCWTGTQGGFLFLNLHPAEILDPGFLDSVRQFSESPVRRHYRLVLEMPESLVCKTDQMNRWVGEIRKMGSLVAYDDFGQGQSRIPDLLDVPPDFLKLDRELISQLGTHLVKLRLVKAIVETCRDLGVKIIGEGIETEEERQACLELGIDYGQGFLLSRPSPAFKEFQMAPLELPGHCPFVRFGLNKPGQ